MNDETVTELEGILAQKQIQMETVRIEHEDQIVVIEQQKAERLADIETEEAVELEKLRQGRDNCANAGNEQAETCRYSIQSMSTSSTFTFASFIQLLIQIFEYCRIQPGPAVTDLHNQP